MSAGSWSSASTSRRTSAATSSSSPSRPARRSASGSNRGSNRTSSRTSWRAAPSPLAGAAPLPQERVADRPAAAGDRLAVTGRGQPGLDLIGLAAAQPGRGDLACLVLGELDPADELTRVDR